MSTPTENVADSLESLRDEIDGIDDRIHSLLMERASVVQRIADVKTSATSRGPASDDDNSSSGAPHAEAGSMPDAPPVVFRPAREALILRRLTERHRGAFPLPVLLRIWREMISGYTRIQGPFSVAACVAEGEHLVWDIARDHFGSCTPIRVMRTPMPCVRAVMDRDATIGVVPWPEDNDPSPWWGSLLSRDPKTPTIVARLPFVESDRNGGGARALAIGRVPHESSGDDRSFIAIELSEDISRSRLKDAIVRTGLTPSAFWSAATDRERAQPLHLIEVEGFVPDGDAALTKIEQALDNRVLRIAAIGGYAVPIDLEPDKSAPSV
ncbi:chorismate mutase [Fodinicurvata sp. EGI_FJ10296]|uniref:chorismate mutase n=1 Tax=Fodinicurvata sp. EGI_FJ10296 TaxID=3231908 RepID=UPI0034569B97